MGRRRTAVLAVVAIAVAVPACGGDDEGTDSTTTAEPVRFGIYDFEANVVGDRTGYATESQAARASGDPDTIVVREVAAQGGIPSFYVLRDRPALTGDDITDPETTEGPDGAPMLAFSFTSEGRRAFQELTRRVARTDGRFAVVAGDELLAIPIVDSSAYPDGLSGENGVSVSAPSGERAEELAAALAAAAP